MDGVGGARQARRMHREDPQTPVTPAEPITETEVPEAPALRIKTGLRAGARDGRIYEADELPGELP